MASSISIKQSLKTWWACLLPTIKLLDASAQNCHVVDWFWALIKALAPVWDEAPISQLKRKLTLLSQHLIDPSEMSNSNSLIFLYIIVIYTFFGLLAPLHREPSTTGTSEKAKEFYHNPGLNTNEIQSPSNHIQISITRGLDIKLKNMTRHYWNYRKSWHRMEGKGWGRERSGDNQPKYGINTKHFATEPFGDCEVDYFNSGTESWVTHRCWSSWLLQLKVFHCTLRCPEYGNYLWTSCFSRETPTAPIPMTTALLPTLMKVRSTIR